MHSTILSEKPSCRSVSAHTRPAAPERRGRRGTGVRSPLPKPPCPRGPATNLRPRSARWCCCCARRLARCTWPSPWSFAAAARPGGGRQAGGSWEWGSSPSPMCPPSGPGSPAPVVPLPHRGSPSPAPRLPPTPGTQRPSCHLSLGRAPAPRPHLLAGPDVHLLLLDLHLQGLWSSGPGFGVLRPLHPQGSPHCTPGPTWNLCRLSRPGKSSRSPLLTLKQAPCQGQRTRPRDSTPGGGRAGPPEGAPLRGHHSPSPRPRSPRQQMGHPAPAGAHTSPFTRGAP